MQLLIDSIKPQRLEIRINFLSLWVWKVHAHSTTRIWKGGVWYWKAIKRGHTTINVTPIWSRPKNPICQKCGTSRSDFFWRCKMNQKCNFFLTFVTVWLVSLPLISFYTLVTRQGKLNIKLRNFRELTWSRQERRGMMITCHNFFLGCLWYSFRRQKSVKSSAPPSFSFWLGNLSWI